MLKIWGRLNSINVEKVVWCAQELALPFERVDAGGTFGGLDTAQFKALNPCGKIPVIEDDGFALWESNTILRYLGAKYGAGTLMPTDIRQRAEAEKWMDFQLSSVGAALSPVFRGLVRTPPQQRDNAQIARAFEDLSRAMTIVDGALEGRDYLAGNSFTVADICLGCAVHRWYNMPVEEASLSRTELGHLSAWYGRLRARPAAAKIMAVPLS